MSPETLTAIGGVAVVVITAVSAAVGKSVGAAGKTIRRLRRNIEALTQVLYDTRTKAIAHGVRRHELPRMPSESDEDFSDEDPA